jgi:hypothetical protein
MKPKTAFTAVLLVFVVASAAYLVFKETIGQRHPAESVSASGENQSAGSEAAGSDKVIVYYFHATKRCWTCRTIEAFTEETIRARFPQQLASGAMEWRTVNVDDPENQHFIEDFEMTTRTVVLVEVEDGVEKKWSRLDRVWELVLDKPAFVDYIWESTNDFLAETNG